MSKLYGWIHALRKCADEVGPREFTPVRRPQNFEQLLQFVLLSTHLRDSNDLRMGESVAPMLCLHVFLLSASRKNNINVV